MTASQIIACAIAWTAAIVAITALVSVRRARRESVIHWRVEYPDGHGMLTTRKPLTEAEVEEVRARWRETYGNNQAAHPVDDERACGCWNGVRCVNHCTCHHCTALRRAAASKEEQR